MDILVAGACGVALGVAVGYALWHAQEPSADDVEATAPAVATAPEPGKVELADEVAQELGIVTAPLQAGSALPGLRAPGRLLADPAFVATVRAPLAGRLVAGERPLPGLGASVRAGEVLAMLAPRLSIAERADLLQRRATAAADEAAITQAVAAARADLDRQRTLHARDNAASQRSVELAEVELATLQARLDVARAVRESLASDPPAPLPLLAAVDGIVDAILAAVGEEIDAGAGLLTIATPGHLVARVEIPTGAAVAANFVAASLELLTDPPQVLQAGFLGWTDATASDRALLLRVAAEDASLRGGLPVVAHLPQRSAPLEGVVVPEAAILRRGDGAFVFVRTAARDGVSTFARLPVTLDAPLEGGWLALPGADGPTAGAALVTVGAGVLFSIERRLATDAEAGG